MRGIFVTGTDTGVGKTWVSGIIAGQMIADEEWTAGLYKPVCSGAEVRDNGQMYWPDVEHLYGALKETRVPVEQVLEKPSSKNHARSMLEKRKQH